jgi:soluble lytic murein transglycosylase-like protein
MRLTTVVLLTLLFALPISSATTGKKSPPPKRYSKEFYHELAYKVAAKYKIAKPHYLYGIWWQESLLDYRAKGDKCKSSGKYYSWGLAQIKLHTAYLYTGKKWKPKQLLVAETNADLSGKIFAGLLQRYNGEYIYAIAAYNDGCKSVDKAYKKDRLPPNYRKYVHKVIRWADEKIPEVK